MGESTRAGRSGSSSPVEDSLELSMASSSSIGTKRPTSAQRSQWLLESLRPGHRGYLLPVLIPLPRDTTWRRLSEALGKVVAAHPALRQSVESSDGTLDGVRVGETPPPGMIVIEPRTVPDLRPESIDRIIEGLGSAVPSVRTGRPWRAIGLVVGERLEALLWLIHHVAVDDPSIAVLTEDLDAALTGRDPAPEETPLLDEESAGGVSALPVVDRLPDFRRLMSGVPVGVRWNRQDRVDRPASRLVRRLDGRILASLDDRLRTAGVSRTIAVLGAVRKAVVAVGAPQHGPFPIGLPFTLRDRPGLDRTVGMLLNTLPVPVDSAWDLPRIGEVVWQVRRCRHVPYEDAAHGVPRVDSDRAPWLDITVGVVERDEEPRRAGETQVLSPGHSPFPVNLVVRFGRQGIQLAVDVDHGWVDASDAERFLKEVERELLAVAREGRLLPTSETGDAPDTAGGHPFEERASDSGPSGRVDVEKVLAALGDADVEVPEDRPLGVLGIDSLDGVRLQRSIERRWGERLPIIRILSSDLRTLRGLLAGDSGPSESVRRADDVSDRPIEAGDRFPISAATRELLLAEMFTAPGMLNLAWQMRSTDPGVDRATIERRLRSVIARHPALRTGLDCHLGAGELPPSFADNFELEWLDAAPDEEQRERIARAPLDVPHGRPLRVVGWRDEARGTELLVVVHHAVIGGRQAQALLQEIAGGSPGPVIKGDRSSGTTSEADVEWWAKRTLDHLQGRWDPALNDSLDFEDVGIDDTAVHRHLHARELAATRGIPGVAPAVTAFGLLLARAMGRRRVVLGVPFEIDVAGSSTVPTAFPIVVDCDPQADVGTLLKQVGESIAEGMEHRRATLGEIGRRLWDKVGTDQRGGQSWLDAVVTFHETRWNSAGWEIAWKPGTGDRFQASLILPETRNGGPAVLAAGAQALAGEPATSMLARFDHLLEALLSVLQEPRDLPVSELPFLTPAQEMMVASNGQPTSATEPRDLVSIVRRVAAERPTEPAVICGERRLTYTELDSWSRDIARRLLAADGAVSGGRVAIVGTRRTSTIAGILGILRAGAAYVPLDPTMPRASLQAVLDAAVVCGVLILDESDESVVDGLAPACFRMTDEDGGDPSDDDAVVDLPDPDPAAAAYVMFTSGSTGEPRGVVVPHRAVARLCQDPWFLPVGPGFRMLHAAPPAFDASTLEIWVPLATGGTICCWEGGESDLAGISAMIARDRVQGCWLTSALFSLAVDEHPELFDDLQVVLTGGEVVSPDHVRRLLRGRPDLAVINGYGPTENTVFTTCESITVGALPDGGSIPIGRPVPGTSVRIVDQDGRLVPPGRRGQLVTGGMGLAAGYLRAGQPERSGGFEQLANDAAPAYATGDFARWLPDGRIEYAGRIDAQVKIAGHRIEPTGVEAEIRRCPGVRDACVVVILENGRKRLGAVVVVDGTGPDAITEHLESRLPAWECPGRIAVVPQIPRTRNGKPDRDAVGRLVQSIRPVVAPATFGESGELLEPVLTAIARVTRTREPDLPLARSGLDSLDLLKISIELEKVLSRPIPLDSLVDGPTPRALADRLAADLFAEARPLVELTPKAIAAERGIYCIPGVGGTVFSYGVLARRLPPNIPLLGLPYPGTADDRTPLRRIEALADTFAETVRQGPAPAMVVGYSIGGFVGFELIRRLADRGCETSLLVIDASITDLPSLARRMTRIRLEDVLPGAIVDRIRDRRRSAMPARLRSVIAAGFDAYRAYRPTAAPVDVTLIRTASGTEHPEDYGWPTVARSVRVKRIEGDHLEVFRRGAAGLTTVVREAWIESTRSA